MTDYATSITTADNPPEPPVLGITWEQNAGVSFVPEMKATPIPRTPATEGAAAVRPQTGLVFPRGM
jgi:hypothetical protein